MRFVFSDTEAMAQTQFFGWDMVAVMIGAVFPVVVLVAAAAFEKHRRKQIEKPPQEEKLLRPPGYSMGLRLDALQDRLNDKVLGAVFCGSLAGASAAFLGKILPMESALIWRILPLGMLVGAAFQGVRLLIQALRSIREASNVRLGLRGEQAVAEALHELGPEGFRAFHDLPAGDDWNIDHVAMGAKGLFMIETKARRRRTATKHKPAHKVTYDGARLEFPSGIDTSAVPQAERNARWLANYIAKKTGETIRVEAIVVLPGWWVSEQKLFPIRVMNCSYLVKYLAGKPEILTKEQVRRIVTALDEKCRTVEF